MGSSSPTTLSRLPGIDPRLDLDVQELDTYEDGASFVEILKDRSDRLRAVVFSLHAKNREFERTAWTTRSELVACKAALQVSQAEASHLWEIVRELDLKCADSSN